MSKIDEIRKRHEELTGKLARLGRHAGLIESAQRAHEDRGELLALFDSAAWQDEKPAAGLWRVSIRPEIRANFPAVVDCEVLRELTAGWVVQYRPGSDLLPLDQDWFTGAKWQRRTVPSDPFAKGGGE